MNTTAKNLEELFGIHVFNKTELADTAKLFYKPANVVLAGIIAVPKEKLVAVKRASPEAFRKLSVERHKLTKSLMGPGAITNILQKNIIQQQIDEISEKMKTYGAQFYVGQTLWAKENGQLCKPNPFVQFGDSGAANKAEAGDSHVLIALGVNGDLPDGLTFTEIILPEGMIDVRATKTEFKVEMAEQDGTSKFELPAPQKRNHQEMAGGLRHFVLKTPIDTKTTPPKKGKKPN